MFISLFQECIWINNNCSNINFIKRSTYGYDNNTPVDFLKTSIVTFILIIIAMENHLIKKKKNDAGKKLLVIKFQLC